MRIKLINFIYAFATLTGVVGVIVIAVTLYFIEWLTGRLKTD